MMHHKIIIIKKRSMDTLNKNMIMIVEESGRKLLKINIY